MGIHWVFTPFINTKSPFLTINLFYVQKQPELRFKMKKCILLNCKKLCPAILLLFISLCFACKTADTGLRIKPLESNYRARSLRVRNSTSNILLFDFTTVENLDDWRNQVILSEKL